MEEDVGCEVICERDLMPAKHMGVRRLWRAGREGMKRSAWDGILSWFADESRALMSGQCA